MSFFNNLTSVCWAAAVALLLGMFATPAHADCEDPKNAFDDVYCYSKLYIEADEYLNKADGELVGLLRKSEKVTVKKGELARTRARNGKCRQQEGNDNLSTWIAPSPRRTAGPHSCRIAEMQSQQTPGEQAG